LGDAAKEVRSGDLRVPKFRRTRPSLHHDGAAGRPSQQPGTVGKGFLDLAWLLLTSFAAELSVPSICPKATLQRSELA